MDASQQRASNESPARFETATNAPGAVQALALLGARRSRAQMTRRRAPIAQREIVLMVVCKTPDKHKKRPDHHFVLVERTTRKRPAR